MRTRPAQLRPPRHQPPQPTAAAKKVKIGAASRIPDASRFPPCPPVQSESLPAPAEEEAVPGPRQSADVPLPDRPTPHLGWAVRPIGGIQVPAPSPPA